MSKKSTLIVLSIIFFVIGLWPVAVILLIIVIATKDPVSPEKQPSPEVLQSEIERLNQEIEDLKAQQFIQDIIDKTSGK